MAKDSSDSTPPKRKVLDLIEQPKPASRRDRQRAAQAAEAENLGTIGTSLRKCMVGSAA